MSMLCIQKLFSGALLGKAQHFLIDFCSSEEPGGGTGWQHIQVLLPSAAPGPVSEPPGFPRK